MSLITGVWLCANSALCVSAQWASAESGSCASTRGAGSGLGTGCGLRSGSGFAETLVFEGPAVMAGLFRVLPLEASQSASFALCKQTFSALSMANIKFVKLKTDEIMLPSFLSSFHVKSVLADGA